MTLLNLGEDIIVSNVAEYLDTKDILHLSLTCKEMRSYFDSNNAYHMLYLKTFGSKPIPLSKDHYDWKHLFNLRTSNAKLFTWGSSEMGRLGYLATDIAPERVSHIGFRKGVHTPTNVDVFNPLVVSDISAGGYSFQILTNDGELYYTGAKWKQHPGMNQLTPGPIGGQDFSPSFASGGMFTPTPLPALVNARARRTRSEGVPPPPGIRQRYEYDDEPNNSLGEVTSANKKRVVIDAKFVTKLDLPEALEGYDPERRSIISISSGRLHFVALDNQNGIYTWDTGNTTNSGVRILFPGIDPKKRITKISCGWNLSACHIKGVGIVVWYSRDHVREDSFEANKVSANARYVIIPGTNMFNPRDFLAGMDYVLIIDEDGKLMRFDLHAQGYADGHIDPNLVDKPYFVPSFNTWCEKSTGSNNVPSFTKLNGCYKLFAIFTSDGKVLLGDKSCTAEDNDDEGPQIIPELQDRGIIEVAMGDYHYLALTDKGELLTWGRESSRCGCLGLGSKETYLQEHPEVPDEVGFDIVAHKPIAVKNPHENGEWIAIAAAGWQSGGIFVDSQRKFTSG